MSSIIDYRVGDLIEMTPQLGDVWKEIIPVGVITKLAEFGEKEWYEIRKFGFTPTYSLCVWNCQIGNRYAGQEGQFQPHENKSIKLIAR